VKIALRNARRLCAPRPVDVARLCAKEARLRERQADSNGIIRWVRRGLHVLDGLDGQPERVERAFLLVLYAWAKNHQGRPKEARRWATLGLEEAERADNRSAIASANLALDGAEVALGNPSDPARARRALAIYEELGLVFEQAVVLNNLGTYAHHQSRWTEALDLYARGRDALVRVGNLVEAAYGTFNIAEVLIDQGRLDEAEPLLDDVEALWRSVDHVLGCCYVEGLRGRLALQRAQPERALERFTSVRATFERAGLATFVLDADAYVAECLLRLGRVDDARAITERGVAQDRAAGGTSVAPALHRIRASCVATTDLDAALDAMHESLRIARARSAVRDVVLALDGIGALLRLGELPIDPSIATERDRLVGDLGIVEVPPPAIPDANQRARRRRPVTAPAGG
jgi:tetratricopeptide (TPR) repeat protein